MAVPQTPQGQAAHSWQPTVADLEAICAVLNRRATRLILTRNGSRLVPVRLLRAVEAGDEPED